MASHAIVLLAAVLALVAGEDLSSPPDGFCLNAIVAKADIDGKSGDTCTPLNDCSRVVSAGKPFDASMIYSGQYTCSGVDVVIRTVPVGTCMDIRTASGTPTYLIATRVGFTAYDDEACTEVNDENTALLMEDFEFVSNGCKTSKSDDQAWSGVLCNSSVMNGAVSAMVTVASAVASLMLLM